MSGAKPQRLQAGAGENDVVHLSNGLGRAACERQEEVSLVCDTLL